MKDRISIEINDGVADVRMIRSDKMNALDDAMFSALIEAGQTLAANTSVRCIVLSGEGRAFCAGLDMGSFGKMAESGSDKGAEKKDNSDVTQGLEPRTHGISNRAQYAVWTWRESPVPVIAAIHGVAFGGGFQIMLGSDIRIAHPETRMSVMEIKWGLVPDMAGTAIMRNLAREDVVRELTYTGRQFNAVEGQALGFVTRTSETPLEEALALAREIADKNPDAIVAAKRIFNSASDMTDADMLLQESVLQDGIIRTPNQVEAVMSTMEKRAANYTERK
ncbi:MAG: crotonase/enoyl-CoA hydratase family protein [Pseudomonadales bacterium]|nr:crotonase/enoyl-CoA hydratase family protein [Pseudomonadales bacterium]MBO6564257.1 crotonase/enoyl-CoA hydratase family protein [Pseudomonadales bacterium]MBO6597565.1 crotonase/enoyl-CoA hydratase family protein [Pseudomonadales bacterium]MBO6824385.1 crotonase/enoyl-CoA hydratase family protein [Pseudomonadales bacterium]